MNESPNQTGPIRSHFIYLPWKIHKALGLLAHASGTTRESIAEEVLGVWMESNHPTIGAWLDKRQSEEKEFQKSISNIPFSKPTCPAAQLLHDMGEQAKQPYSPEVLQ